MATINIVDALGESVDLKNCIVVMNELAGGMPQAAEHLEGLPAFLTNSMPSLIERGSLAEGTLGIYIPRVKHPLHFLWLAIRALVRGPKGIEPLEILVARDVVIDTMLRNLVALDGEVAAMVSSSLHPRCRPGTCRIRVPKAVWGS